MRGRVQPYHHRRQPLSGRTRRGRCARRTGRRHCRFAAAYREYLPRFFLRHGPHHQHWWAGGGGTLRHAGRKLVSRRCPHRYGTGANCLRGQVQRPGLRDDFGRRLRPCYRKHDDLPHPRGEGAAGKIRCAGAGRTLKLRERSAGPHGMGQALRHFAGQNQRSRACFCGCRAAHRPLGGQSPHRRDRRVFLHHLQQPCHCAQRRRLRCRNDQDGGRQLRLCRFDRQRQQPGDCEYFAGRFLRRGQGCRRADL